MTTTQRSLPLTRIATLFALAALLVTLSAVPAGAGDFRAEGKVVQLDQTKAGALIKASGAAKLVENGNQFALLVTADVVDGTTFLVEGRIDGGKSFDVGTVTMLLGAGTLELPDATFPVGSLSEVTVSRKGTVVLGSKLG